MPVTGILEQFETLFPDGNELSARTGWDLPVIGTIDVYRNSPAVYSFAPAAAIVEEAKAYFGELDRHIRARRALPAAGAAVAEAPGVTGQIAGPWFATAGAFLCGLPREKNFARSPLPALLDSRKPPAYLSATLALALGEC